MQVLRAILLAIIAVVLLLAGTLTLVDLGRFKGLIVHLASGWLEREVIIDGPLSIQLGRKVFVSVNGLRVASTDWSAEPDLVAIGEVSLVVDTASILSGVLVVDELQAHGIHAHLAVNEAGEDNYSLAASKSDDAGTMPVVLKLATISDLSIGYSDPALPPLKLAFSRMDLRQAPQGDLRFELAGDLNDTALTASGTAGPLDNIIAGVDVSFELAGDLGEISLTASGRIDDLAKPRRPTAAFAIDAPDAEYLTGILGIDPVTGGPLDLEGNLTPAVGRVQVGVDGTFGEFELQLAASLADLQTTDDLDLELKASGPSAATVARLAGREDFPPLPFVVDAAGRIEGEHLQTERLFVDVGAAQLEATAEVPRFPGLDGARLQVTARGPQFGDFNRLAGLPGRLTGPFEINAELVQTAGGRGAVQAEVMAEAIRLAISGEVSADPALVGSRFDVEATADDVSVLADAFDFEAVPTQPAGVRVTLTVREGAIGLQGGEATLGAERVVFEGSVGLQPFSPLTGFQASTRIVSVHKLFESLGLAAPQVPDGALSLSTEVAHDDEDAFLVKAFTARFKNSVQADISGRIADSFELAQLEFDVRGDSLAAIAPVEKIRVAEPFRVSGALALGPDDVMEVSDLQARVGNARATGELAASAGLQSGRATIEANAPSLAELVPEIAGYLPAQDALVVRGKGRWQDQDLWLEPVVVTVGEARFKAEGQLRALPDPTDSVVAVSAYLPRLSILQFLTDQPLPDDPLSADLTVRGTPRDLQFTVRNLTLGASRIEGSAALRQPAVAKRMPVFDVELRSPLLDLRAFQRDPAERPRAQKRRTDPSRLIPDTPVPVAALNRFQGTFDLAAAEIRLRNTRLLEVVLKGAIGDGTLRVDRVAMAGARGDSLTGNGSVVRRKSGVDISFRASGANLILGLPAKTAREAALLPEYEIRTELEASGATLRELAASTTGYLRMVAGEGRLNLASVGFLSRDFASELINAVNPLARKERLSRVECIGVLIEAIDGVIVGEPALVFQSDKLNITGIGRVDLRSERLNVNFNTQPREGLGISLTDLVSPLTQVGGTLAKPTLQLDADSALVEGTAAVATLGLSFLAKKAWDRIFSDPQPCRRAIREADADLESRGVPAGAGAE